jgi:hypothetical protein
MAYRDPEAGEVLERYEIVATKGAELTGILAACALAALVALFIVLVAVFGALAARSWKSRKRPLLVMRFGSVMKLVVPASLELTFPLTMTGSQTHFHSRGAALTHLYLKLVDARGNALLLGTQRGDGLPPEPHWPDALDATTPAASYELAAIVALRADLARLNALGS